MTGTWCAMQHPLREHYSYYCCNYNHCKQCEY